MKNIDLSQINVRWIKEEIKRENNRQYYNEHSEKVKAKDKQYQKLYPEKKKKRDREYYIENSEKIKTYDKQYQKLYPEKVKAKDHKRRTRKTNNGGSFTAKEWLDLKAYYKYTCLCCKKCEPEIKLCSDHIVPVSKGGSSNIENIQPLCVSCNCRKNNKIFDYRQLSTIVDCKT